MIFRLEQSFFKLILFIVNFKFFQVYINSEVVVFYVVVLLVENFENSYRMLVLYLNCQMF